MRKKIASDYYKKHETVQPVNPRKFLLQEARI